MTYEDKLFDDLQEQMVINQALAKMKSCVGNKEALAKDAADAELEKLLLELQEDVAEPVKETVASTPPTATQSKPVATVSPAMPTAPMPSNAESGPPYSFPVTADVVEPCLMADLAERMARLVAEWKKHGDYMRIRVEYCGLAIALNHEGLLAPAFRSMPTIPYLKARRTPSNMTMHRDFIVIDCHWLYCRGKIVDAHDAAKDYLDMFDSAEEFSFDLANDFACKNWANRYRSEEVLVLTPVQRCQLKTMKGKIVGDRYMLAKKGLGKGESRIKPKIIAVKEALAAWCHKDKRIIRERQCYENLWLAQELLGKDASIRDIAELGGLMSGQKPLAEKTVREKLQKFAKRLPTDLRGGMSGSSSGTPTGTSIKATGT